MNRPARSGMCAGGLLVASAAASVAVTVGPAAAHTELVGSSPPAGTTVTTVLREVSLEFEEPPSPRVLQVAVIGPDGRDLVKDAPRLSGNRVTVSIRRPTQPGRYEVSFRVAAGDDHPETGSVGFRISREGAMRATGSTQPTQPTQPGARAGAGPESSGPAVSPSFARSDATAPRGGAESTWAWAALGCTLLGLGVSAPLVRRAVRRSGSARLS